jgi:hypothetical protein
VAGLALAIYILATPHLVPVVSQLAPSGAGAAYRGSERCGPTVMAMVARAFGVAPAEPDAALIERLDLVQGTPNRKTAAPAIQRMARTLGLRSRRARGFRWRFLDRALERGAVVLAVGDARELPHNRWRSGDGTPPTGHWIAIVDRDAWGNLVIHDPFFGPGTGLREGRYVLEPQQLAAFVGGLDGGGLVSVF